MKTAHDEAKDAGKSDSKITSDMKRTIDKQIARGIYISPHLVDRAVDVRSRDMSTKEKKAFIESTKGVTKKPPLLEGERPHWHLQF